MPSTTTSSTSIDTYVTLQEVRTREGRRTDYALYVQANPVPDPDLLPLSRNEAVLLTIEGSKDMTTQEPVETQPTPRPTKHKGLAAAGAIAAVAVVGLVAALLIGSDDSQPVAAADAAPVVVFDGSTCTYDGPSEIEEGMVSWQLTNTGSQDFVLGGWLLEGAALETELQRTPVGTDMDITSGDPVPDGEVVFGWWLSPGESQTNPRQMASGTYLIDCKTDDHVWRVAQIDMVAP